MFLSGLQKFEQRAKKCIELRREIKVKKVNQSHYRPKVPRGFQEVKVPRFHDNGTGWW